MATSLPARVQPDAVDKARALLATTGWLAATDTSFAKAVLDLCRWRLLQDGEVLSHPDQEDQSLFGVGAGHLAGDQHPLGSMDVGLTAIWHVGSWVGHAPLVMGVPRRGVVRARGEALVAIAPGASLQSILKESPHWWREVGKLPFILSQMFAGAGHDLLRHSAHERCLAVLLMLAGCRWTDPPTEPPFVAPISQAELGERCNLSRNGVIKALAPLAAAGLITLGYRQIRVNDSRALRARLRAGQ